MFATWRWLAVVLVLASGSARAGPGVWTSNGPWGGVVPDIDIHPTIPTTLYATTFAGIYKSVDGGASWTRADRGIAAGVITFGVLIDRDDPDTLYAFDRSLRLHRSVDGAANWQATGYTAPSEFLTDWDDQPGTVGTFLLTSRATSLSGPGLRVRRTTDGGATFAASVTGLPADRSFADVTYDPANGLVATVSIELHGVGTGVPAGPSIYRSIDGGATWTGVLTFATTGSTPGAGDVSFGAGTTVYAYANGAIHRSGDDGATWNGPFAALSFVDSLVAHPTVAGTLFVGNRSGMQKSTDSGMTFAPINTGLTPNATYTHVNTAAALTAEVRTIAIEPGFPGPGSGIWLATSGAGLFRSVDAGATWSGAGVNDGVGGVSIRGLLVHPNPSARVAPGAPGARVYAGFGQPAPSPGGYLSTNGTATWNASNNQLRAQQLRSIIIDPTTAGTMAAEVGTSVLFAAGSSATTDGFRNGGLYKSSNGGAVWTSFDGDLPTSTSGGIAFANIGIVDKVVLDPRSCTIPPVGPCATGPLRRLYATAAGRETLMTVGSSFISTLTHRIVRTDNADTASPAWTDISATLPGNQRIQDCSVSGCPIVQTSIAPNAIRISPNDSNVIFVGTAIFAPFTPGTVDVPNGVFRSNDGGMTWTHASNGLPRRSGFTNMTSDVLALAMHPTNPDILWMSTAYPDFDEGPAAVYKTVDGGANWFESSGGISVRVDLRAIVVDPADPDTLYAAGTGDEANPGNVYKSEDGGATWRSISIGLPRDAALTLTQDPFVPTVLHAGTLSGVWSLEQVPDEDGDGAPDATENNAPNGGDGNNDTMPDAKQGDVGSSVVILRPGPRGPLGAGGFFTSDIISGTPTVAGGCTQAVDVQAELAARHGRDAAPGGFFDYPRDLVRFEILDCAQAIVDITFHGANFATQYGWTFRFYGPQTPGALDSIGFYDFTSRATRVATDKWRLTLSANQFGSYRAESDAILFEGGPACYDDRTFQNGFEDGSGFTPPACN